MEVKIANILAVLVFIILLEGCTNTEWNNANGVILDKDTRKPINHAGVSRYAPHTYVDINETFSDSLGRFHYTTMHRSTNFIYFSKEGFLTTKIQYSTEKKTDTILLEHDNKGDTIKR